MIDSIKSIDLQAIKLLLKLRLADFWKKINGNFLLSVVLGIAISIFSLAKLMTWLLDNHPIYIWSFFFGLIIASSVLVAKEIKKWNILTIISMLAGVAIAWWITVMTPSETPDTWWFIILSGAIAICAMILPGISGAFILLLMGKYSYILGAVSNLQIGILLLFVIGAVAGITSFSHLLSWLLKNYHTVTVSLLTGFMVGLEQGMALERDTQDLPRQPRDGKTIDRKQHLPLPLQRTDGERPAGMGSRTDVRRRIPPHLGHRSHRTADGCRQTRKIKWTPTAS